MNKEIMLRRMCDLREATIIHSGMLHINSG